jgi:hypothetical protein
MKITKRIGKGQQWGTIGLKRTKIICAKVSTDKLTLAQYRARGLGMTVSNYLNHLLAQDIGPGYNAA